MNAPSHDVVIIGGGPGGSSAAGYLSRAGRRVLLLEKEVFPRFHIGESLLPYIQPILRELGVLPEVAAAGFPRKTGAQFHLGNGTGFTQFIFAEGKFTREGETFQVERSVFDHILLKHARKCGADAREGWSVLKYAADSTGVLVEARGPDGQNQQFRGAFLIDASGRSNLTGNQAQLRVIHPHHKKLSVFGHFTGVALDEGERKGDTIIVRLENKWFWIIPISSQMTSVGLVIDQEEFAQMGGDPAAVFEYWLKSSRPVAERMTNARLAGALRTTSDFSYHNRQFVGPRLLRVGDAAGFMDPIFSAGVFLAMWSGKLAAEAITNSLAAHDDGAHRFRLYEKRVRRALRFYWRIIGQYYTKPFMELFLQPRNHFDLPAAVNAVLAGDLDAGWTVRWRLEYFFFLVRLQAHWPVVPRLSLADPRNAQSGHKQPNPTG